MCSVCFFTSLKSPKCALTHRSRYFPRKLETLRAVVNITSCDFTLDEILTLQFGAPKIVGARSTNGCGGRRILLY